MASIEFPLAFKRQFSGPLDDSSVFASLTDLNDYVANNPAAYDGQIMSVSTGAEEGVYVYLNGTVTNIGDASSTTGLRFLRAAGPSPYEPVASLADLLDGDDPLNLDIVFIGGFGGEYGFPGSQTDFIVEIDVSDPRVQAWEGLAGEAHIRSLQNLSPTNIILRTINGIISDDVNLPRFSTIEGNDIDSAAVDIIVNPGGISGQVDSRSPEFLVLQASQAEMQAGTETEIRSMSPANIKEAIDALGVTNIEWKASVATFADLATTYPDAEEGWTASVDDQNLIYRYEESSPSGWVEIFSSSVPLASETLDGKLSNDDFNAIQRISDLSDWNHITSAELEFNPPINLGNNSWFVTPTSSELASGIVSAEINVNLASFEGSTTLFYNLSPSRLALQAANTVFVESGDFVKVSVLTGTLTEQQREKLIDVSVSTNTIEEADSAVTVTDTGFNGRITFKTDNTDRWYINEGGNLIPQVAKTYNAGEAARPLGQIYISDYGMQWIDGDNGNTAHTLNLDANGDLQWDGTRIVYQQATQVEMEAGTETEIRTMSPANVKQAIDGANVVTSTDVTNIVKITQVDYDALAAQSPSGIDDNTLYVIV